MNTAIIINLDYENIPIEKCRHVWELIEVRMEKAGFVKSNRIFVTNMDSETAYKQARGVTDSVFEEFLTDGEGVAPYLKEFYGIPYAQIVDLSKPTVHEIKVDMMATGTFQKFFT